MRYKTGKELSGNQKTGFARRKRLALVSILALFICAGGTCVDPLNPFGIIDGDTFFDPFGGEITEEEFLAYLDELRAFEEDVAALPDITIRIENLTSAIAYVELISAVEPPPFPGEDFGGRVEGSGFGFEGPFLSGIDFDQLLIEPNGTVSGPVKCGEVIAVSAIVPADPAADFFFGPGVDAFGLFISQGNVSFSGLGSPPEDDFTGDIVEGARFVQPAIDGINCESDTLVIRITTTATVSVFDPDTGELISGGSLGTGTISSE